MKSLKLILFTACCAAAVTVLAQGNRYILALSKGEKSLFVLDYKTLDTVRKIAVGDDPHEIVTNPGGTLAYISKPLMNDHGHEIAVVNLKTGQREASIDTKPFFIPHGLVYLSNRLWFTAQGAKVVGVYNIATKSIEQVWGTGQDFTHLIHVTADQTRFYTTNVESGTVSIYEQLNLPPYMPPTGVLPPNAKPRTEWRQTLVNVGLGAEGFDISPDGKELWTARPDGHVVIVDLEKKTVTADIDSKIQGLHRLKMTPDGKTVIIVSVKTGDLLYFNAHTRDLEQIINTGHGAGLYIDEDSNRLFVSCTSDNRVIIIDLKTRKEIGRISIARPDGITSAVVE